ASAPPAAVPAPAASAPNTPAAPPPTVAGRPPAHKPMAPAAKPAGPAQAAAPPPVAAAPAAPAVPPLTLRPMLPQRLLVVMGICRGDAERLCPGFPRIGPETPPCLPMRAESLSPTCSGAPARVTHPEGRGSSGLPPH